MATYTPAIYKQLGGTTVAIDLSALADIGEVQDGVQTLSQQTSDIAESTARIETGNTNVGTLVTDAQGALTQRFDTTDSALAANEANAVARQAVLLEAIAGITVDDDEHPEIDRTDRAVLLDILQAQTVVLNGKAVGEELANRIVHQLETLDAGTELVAAFKSAAEMDGTAWPARSRRFWALYDLIEEVTDD